MVLEEKQTHFIVLTVLCFYTNGLQDAYKTVLTVMAFITYSWVPGEARVFIYITPETKLIPQYLIGTVSVTVHLIGTENYWIRHWFRPFLTIFSASHPVSPLVISLPHAEGPELQRNPNSATSKTTDSTPFFSLLLCPLPAPPLWALPSRAVRGWNYTRTAVVLTLSVSAISKTIYLSLKRIVFAFTFHP